MNKLKRSMKHALAQGLDVRSLFHFADDDHDEQIGPDELQAFATALDRVALAEGIKLGLKEGGYKSLLKESRTGNYAPTFRQKITISEEGRSPCKFFDESKRRLSYSSRSSGSSPRTRTAPEEHRRAALHPRS